MALEQEYLDIRKDHGDEQHRYLCRRLKDTLWVHYRNNATYRITDVYWDATQDEWAVRYVRTVDRLSHIDYGRVLSDWCSQLIEGPRFREIQS